MTNRFIRPLLCGGLLMFAVLVPASVPAAPVVFSCSPTKVKGIASNLASSKSAATFGNFPEASVNFVQGGSSPSCVIVRFSAEVFAGIGQNVEIRAVLDSVATALPAAARYTGDDTNWPRARSFEFVFPSVAPGYQVVRMQYRSTHGGTVFVERRNMVVQFAP